VPGQAQLRMLVQMLTLTLLLGFGLVMPVLSADSGSAGEITQSNRYVVREASIKELHRDAPQLPDLSAYTTAAVKARIPTTARGRTAIRRMVDLEALGEFVSGQRTTRLKEWASRQNTNPVVIVVEGGHLDLRQLARQLSADHISEDEPGIFTLRLPLLVAQGASLVIDDSVKELRLSQEAGAFLVNDGKLFIVDTRVTSWREREGTPAAFRSGDEFRPFMVSWGGSELYIAGSTIVSLGYSASKAYGISISQYSPARQKRLQRPSPKGWVLESEFIDNWFGFYCFEADKLVVHGNRYRNSIVYGIDPHDRSHGLIIANNRIHDTRKKHGLIVSREVSSSWIFGNVVTNSGLSGIVIDRSSVSNIVADNTVYNNGGDGITIYESPDNLLWGNRSVGNAKHGIRVRNSMRIKMYNNLSIANHFSGIYGHVKDLSGTDRNLRIDPFEQHISMVVVGGQLVHNGSSPVSIDKPLSLELYDVDLLAPASSTGISFSGVLGENQHRVLDLLLRQRLPVLIEPAEEPAGRRS